MRRSPSARAVTRASPLLLAACGAVAHFAADDTLRAVLLRERSELGEAVMQLTRAAWDEAADPCSGWALGTHVSSAAPALAAVLLGDVEGEGAPGGVALSPAAVRGVVEGVVRNLAGSGSSGTSLWRVLPRLALSLSLRCACSVREDTEL